MSSFPTLGVSPSIIRALTDLGFENPMPVQEQVIPFLLGNRRDVIALAQTGTGKTAAYGIPVIQLTDPEQRSPQALILSPTRELCVQIATDLTDFAVYEEGLKILPVYGGSSIENQIKALKKGVHIVVATPGRLCDLIRRKAIRPGGIRTVVLDEADEMLNMGFLESINEILAVIPQGRQTLLFSATMPKEVSDIAGEYMDNPTEITIGSKNSGAENIRHVYYTVHAKDKYVALKRIVDYYPDIYGIIFCRTRKDTQEIADKLIADGYNADALHGDLSQPVRDSVMQKFRIRHLQLLVATDVAARGLDVNNLTHIINYALPDDLQVYTHRSGRTARAGKTGISIAIINLKEKHLIRQIEKQTGKPFVAAKVPGGREICEKQLFNLIHKMENVELENPEIDSYLPAIFRKLEWLDKEEVIKRFVALEFNRFLEYYKDDRDVNVHEEPAGKPGSSGKREHRFGNAKELRVEKRRDGRWQEWMETETVKDGKKRDKKQGKSREDDHRGDRSMAEPEQSGMTDGKFSGKGRREVTDFTRLTVNLGKNQGLWPNILIEIINTASPGKRIRIGDITLGRDESVFEVDTAYAELLANSLGELEFNGTGLVVGKARDQERVKVEGRRVFGKKWNSKEQRAPQSFTDAREKKQKAGKKGPKESERNLEKGNFRSSWEEMMGQAGEERSGKGKKRKGDERK
jgi:ATP-dependent RNA helicase DeaD